MRAAGRIAGAACLGTTVVATGLAGAAPPAAPPAGLHPRILPLRPGSRLPFRRRFGIRPLVPFRGIGPNVPPYLLPPPPPDTFVQPEGPGPSPLIEGTPEDLPAFAHGFHLSVKVGDGQTFASPPVLNRFAEVAPALGRCFSPPAGVTWGSVTLRVSFKRDGSVFGLPLVPYSDAATADQKSDLAQSLLAGLKRCTPLPLSPSLGAAVAGEIFAIRFIHEDKR